MWLLQSSTRVSSTSQVLAVSINSTNHSPDQSRCCEKKLGTTLKEYGNNVPIQQFSKSRGEKGSERCKSWMCGGFFEKLVTLLPSVSLNMESNATSMEIQAVPQWVKCYCVSDKGYGFHSTPLFAWPWPGTFQIRPFRSKSQAPLSTEGRRAALLMVRNYWGCPNSKNEAFTSPQQDLWLCWGLQRSPRCEDSPAELRRRLVYQKHRAERYTAVFCCCRVFGD